MNLAIGLIPLRSSKVGLDLCCGGLFGMGESLQDRVDLAYALADLNVDSVWANTRSTARNPF